MGYRHYFYKVKKSEVDAVKGMTFDELMEYAKQQGAECNEDGDGWFSFIDDEFMNKECVFELGKLYWDDTADQIYATGVPLFENPEVQRDFSDFDPFVVGKDGIKKAIEIYTRKVLDYFKSLAKPGCVPEKIDPMFMLKPDDLDLGEVCKAVSDKISRWSNIFGMIPYSMDEDNSCIINSWLYEYEVFELVRLYKSIDWDNYTILFFGY